MKHRELFNSEEYPPGQCVACGASLAGRRSTARGQGGAPRTVLCGADECLTAYWTLRKQRIYELAQIGIEAERRRKENA